ncbi:MAG: hypothetical protein A3G24_03690 [Betaproteobacteria bacterium RIFCSPLOWO2_12_FULL_62_13]|nr:MAG: hypothetical protein A3G24_03690 [Betaproteobacteria bacterium RIFCSPLOWO2_12_FULL_62_13]
MSTVYLHIGLPKTATSTVQGAIQKLRLLIAARGYWTPRGIMAHHRFAVGAVDPGDPRLKQAHYQRVLASGNDAVFAEFEQAWRDGRNILVSSEYLNDCGGRAAAGLLTRFGVNPADVRVVVCLRRQDRMIASHYNQQVERMGRRQQLAWSHEEAASWDWYQKLSQWAEPFGDDALRVLVYERIVQQPSGILFARVILGACDLGFEDAEFASIAGEADDHRNANLPAELVEFKRAANTVTHIGDVDWLIEQAMAAGIGNTPFRLDRALATEIVEYYKPSNTEVARRFLKESGPLFDDDLDDADTVAHARFNPRIMSQLVALLAAEIGGLRKKFRSAQKRETQSQPRH